MTSTTTLYDIAGSTAHIARAREVMPFGLASTLQWRRTQVVFDRGRDGHLIDIDGNDYVDLLSAHGPVLLGHDHPRVRSAVERSLDRGVQFGGPSPEQAELAGRVLDLLEGADKVVWSNSGSEACALAVRLARVHTGRRLVVKFAGHYHGTSDGLYVNCHGADPERGVPSLAPSGLPVIPMTDRIRPPDDVVVTIWNDLAAFDRLMSEVGDQVAAVIMEPLATGFGTYRPDAGYLEGLIATAHAVGALVVFDEVVSGFRVAPGGARELLGVQPDIGVYAKGFANGFPIAMVAITTPVAAHVDNVTMVAAGTYNATPASVSAALAVLDTIQEAPDFYTRLDGLGRRLADGFREAGVRRGAPVRINQIGSLVQLFWGDLPDTHSYAGVSRTDAATVAEIVESLIARGVYAQRKGLFFLNAAHTHDDIDRVIECFDEVLRHRLRPDLI